MKNSEIWKQAIASGMPDTEKVRKRCIEELHKEDGKEQEQRKDRFQKRRPLIAGVGICITVLLCFLIMPKSSYAEPFLVRMQAWLHLNQKEVSIGEMTRDSIHIPEDCDKIEMGGVSYLAKNYSTFPELEEDIGKHIDIWRNGPGFMQDGVALNVAEHQYARITLLYDDISQGKGVETWEKLWILKLYITIPLSRDFSMNKIEAVNRQLDDQQLKYASFDKDGNIESYAQNDQYSLLETYHSEHLDTDISVIVEKTELNIGERQKEDDDAIVYYFYFVHRGFSYQMICCSNLATAKSIIEEFE